MIAEGDKVVTRYRGQGTQRGDLMGTHCLTGKVTQGKSLPHQ